MATRLKTVEFAAGVLTSHTDGTTVTSCPQDTIYLPESGKTFRSVVALTQAQATVGTGTAGPGNITTRQYQARLAAAGYTTNTNSNTYTGSGEDMMVFHGTDLTSHFTTNWTGTSMTYDSQVAFDQSNATTPGWTNITQQLFITYEYDDTSATQIKTVRIPLNVPVGALATSKPGAANATIPNLSTELPEGSKVFRDAHIVIQGNTANATGTTDKTITMQLDSTASHTTGVFEGGGNTDHFFRYVWDCLSVLNTSASMGFYIWANAAKFNHIQAWLVVTYEFDATASNDVFVSVMLGSDGGLGGQNTSSDFGRLFTYLDIQEPGTITTKQLAYYGFWDDTGAVAGLNMRLGTGSFVAYTDTSATMAGCNAAMVRNDSAFTLTRGFNTLSVDVYCTETTQDFVTALNGFFIVNYTASKPSQGYGAANHTVEWWMQQPFSGTAPNIEKPAAWAPVLPSAQYRMSNVTVHFDYFVNSTNGGFGCHVDVERLAAEDVQSWDIVAGLIGISDFETGLRCNFVNATEHFKRFPTDIRPAYNSYRRDIETSRRWRASNGSVTAIWDTLSLMMTYHSISYTVAGSITNSAGGTVNIRCFDAVDGELLGETSRTGNGAFSFTVYDNTHEMFVEAYEDGTHLGRSANGTAS